MERADPRAHVDSQSLDKLCIVSVAWTSSELGSLPQLKLQLLTLPLWVTCRACGIWGYNYPFPEFQTICGSVDGSSANFSRINPDHPATGSRRQVEQVHGALRLGRRLAVQQPGGGLRRHRREEAGRHGVPVGAEPGPQPGARFFCEGGSRKSNAVMSSHVNHFLLCIRWGPVTCCMLACCLLALIECKRVRHALAYGPVISA